MILVSNAKRGLGRLSSLDQTVVDCLRCGWEGPLNELPEHENNCKGPLYTCDACQDEYHGEEFPSINENSDMATCQHYAYCRSCLPLWLESQIDQHLVLDTELVCPHCRDCPVSPHAIGMQVSKELYNKYLQVRLEKVPFCEVGYKKVKHHMCGWISMVPDSWNNLDCNKCRENGKPFRFCVLSEEQHEAHPEFKTCAEYKASLKNRKDTEDAHAIIVQNQARQCPAGCGRTITKAAGCQHMDCPCTWHHHLLHFVE